MNGVRVTLAVLLLSLAAGRVVAAEPAGFRFREVDAGALALWDGERPVLVYNHGIRGKEGVPADRKRSSYVHPLYGLDGEALTDDFPEDHYHHRGLFWAWPHVQVGGKAYDLWMLRGIAHRFERWVQKRADADRAVLGVENGWYVGERRVVGERVTLTVHPVKDGGRLIDVELRLTAEKEPVTLGGGGRQGVRRDESEVRPAQGHGGADAGGRGQGGLEPEAPAVGRPVGPVRGRSRAERHHAAAGPGPPRAGAGVDYPELRLPGGRLAGHAVGEAGAGDAGDVPLSPVGPPGRPRRRNAVPLTCCHEPVTNLSCVGSPIPLYHAAGTAQACQEERTTDANKQGGVRLRDC